MKFSRVVFLLLAASSCFAATTYDLQADFSTVSNPNGPWAYRQGAGLMVAGDANAFFGGALGAPTPGWTGPFPDALFKAVVNGPGFDYLAGEIVAHTDTGGPNVNILWTAPFAGTANITGFTWIARDIGRSNTWSLLHNGVPITSGLIFSGDPFSEAFPFQFVNGSGGAGALTNVAIALGDTIELLYTNPGVGDLVGMNLNIELGAVPEPSASLLVSTVLAGLAGFRFRRRK